MKTANVDKHDEGLTLLIVYSGGDIGDVGRHCVALALRNPGIKRVWVLTKQPPETLYEELHYRKCSCPPLTHELLGFKHRLHVYSVDVCKDDLMPFILGSDCVISCLGSRQPFHSLSNTYIAKHGTEKLVQSLLYKPQNQRRIIQLSSVGIGNDWPPLDGLRQGRFLAGLFRTICWSQYQDFSAAERAVHRGWSSKQLDYVTVRCVVLPDEKVPQGNFRVLPQAETDQVALHEGQEQRLPFPVVQHAAGIDYGESIAKLDVARFLVQEAVNPTYHRKTVVIGGVPPLAATKNVPSHEAATAASHSSLPTMPP